MIFFSFISFKKIPNLQYVILGIFIANIFINIPAFNNNFASESTIKLITSPLIHSNINVSDSLFEYNDIESEVSRSYSPLTIISYQLMYNIFNINHPLGYHIVNIFIHTYICFLIYWVAFIFFNSQFSSIIITLLFISFGLHSETVNDISQLPILMMTCFILYAFIFLTKVISIEDKHKRLLNISYSSGLYLLGLLCNEYALIFLFLLITYLWLLKNQNKINSISNIFKELYPFLIVTIIYLLLRTIKYGNPISYPSINWVNNPLIDSSLTLVERALTLLSILGNYLYLIIFPFNVKADYSFLEYTITSNINIYIIIALVAILTYLYCVKRYYSQNKTLFFILFIIFWSYVLNANALFYTEKIISPNYIYFTSFFICLFIGYLISCNIEKHKILNERISVVFWGILIVILIINIFSKQDRNSVWKSQTELFNTEVLRYSNSCQTFYNLANVSNIQGNKTQAISLLKYSLQLNENFFNAWKLLITICIKDGDFELAKTFCYKAMGYKSEPFIYSDVSTSLITREINPPEITEDALELQYLLGLIEYKRGYIEKAEHLWNGIEKFNCRALGLVYEKLGVLSTQRNNINKAISYFSKAIYLKPYESINYINLANIYKSLLKFDDAKKYLLKGIDRKIENAELYYELSDLLVKQKNFDDAQKNIEIYLNYNPNSKKGLELKERIIKK